MYEDLLQLNNTKKSILKWEKLYIQMDSSHMKNFSILLDIWEMKRKTTMRQHYTVTRMAINQKTDDHKHWGSMWRNQKIHPLLVEIQIGKATLQNR